MADVETTDAAKGAKGLRFKKRTTTTTTRTENGVGGIGKKKEVVEEVEKKTKVEEVAGKKVEVTTEKKRIEVREEKKKGDERKEVKEDRSKKEQLKKEETKVKKEVVEDEEKENGVAEEEGTEKKKKKKHRDREDGERRKKKKKRDSEKENKEVSGSSSGEEDDDEALPAPTPPLFNGHAILRDSGCNGRQMKDENLSDEEPLITTEENHKKEDFHSLLHAYKENSLPVKEPQGPTPLSDEEDLAGVSVKQLRVSYLSVAQDAKRTPSQPHKVDIPDEIKADLNTSVNISSLVDTYSSPQHRSVTPSRPDDYTPVSLRSLVRSWRGWWKKGSQHMRPRRRDPPVRSAGIVAVAAVVQLVAALHQRRN